MSYDDLANRRIRHFMSVYEHQSFSTAATALHISQPALSNSIQKLEQMLAVSLFERNARGVIPTPYGEVLYRRGRQIRSEHHRVLEDIKALRDGSAGILKVGAGPSVSHQLAEVIREFITARPSLKLSLYEGPEEELLQKVLEGSIDFAISTMSCGDVTDDDLYYEPLFSNPTTALVRAAHPLAQSPQARWNELALYPWIIGDTRVEPLDIQLLDAAARWNPPTVIVSNSAAFSRCLAECSDFVTFMPATLAGPNSSLVAIGSSGGVFSADIGLTMKAGVSQTPAAQQFLKDFRQSCENLGLKRVAARQGVI